MKKLISLLIICTLLFSSLGMLCASATENTKIHNDTLEYVSNEFGIAVKEEQKIICKATLDDEFEDDSIIVVFKNSKSKNLDEYTTKSFPEITAASVKDLTTRSKNKIEKQREKKIQINNSRIIEKSATIDEMHIDEDKFHQFVKIDLGVKSKENVLKCIKKLEARDDILMVFPNYIYKAASIGEPNDPEYQNDEQWAIDKIKLPDAWEITKGTASVKVGVLDSGIYGNHPDLTGRVNRTLSEDFTGGNSPLTDEAGHGTVVAGVIGAQGNNSIGITGVCWNISLVSLKVAVPNGNVSETVFGAVQSAIDYATDNNIPILNFSYGGGNMGDEVRIALGNYPGLFVCAAGNQAKDISSMSFYPVDYGFNNVICVAGTNEDDELYLITNEDGTESGSNYSSTKVALAAPGYNICTTSSSGGYTNIHGTSLAAPFVTGVAALLKSEYPNMSAQAMKYYILGGVETLEGKLGGKVSTKGRLDAENTLNKVTTFTVKYNSNGGTGTMSDTKVIYYNRTPLRANTFTKEYFTFKGWYAKRASDNKWCYHNGTTYKWCLEGSQPSGYTKYLYVDKRTVIDSTSVNGDTVTMYAQWKRNYVIKFDPNHGTGSMSFMTISYGDTKQLRLNTFEALREEECYFHHWYAKRKNSENVDEIYYTNGSNSGWFTLDDKPSGYTRVDIANGITINDDTFEGVCDNDVITLYAYWQPRVGVLGDANQNGVINAQDVTLIQKHLSHQVTINPEDNQWVLCDVNFDGNITVADSTLIQKYVARQIDEFGS